MRMKFILLLLSFLGFYSHASTYLSGTRFIYNSKDKQIIVQITNSGDVPVLVQSWIDNGDIDADPRNLDVPFFISPPIARINEEKSQALRIGYTGNGLPGDRESIFWLNVLEVAQSNENEDENKLQLAYRTRVKIFYRPDDLQGNASQAAESLSWKFEGDKLIAENNSPFYVSLVGINYKTSAGEGRAEADMVAPFSSQSFEIKDYKKITEKSISYDFLNDWGALISKNVSLDGI